MLVLSSSRGNAGDAAGCRMAKVAVIYLKTRWDFEGNTEGRVAAGGGAIAPQGSGRGTGGEGQCRSRIEKEGEEV